MKFGTGAGVRQVIAAARGRVQQGGRGADRARLLLDADLGLDVAPEPRNPDRASHNGVVPSGRSRRVAGTSKQEVVGGRKGVVDPLQQYAKLIHHALRERQTV